MGKQVAGVRETSLPQRASGHDDAAQRESERPYERRSGAMPAEQRDAGRLIAEDKFLEAKPDSIPTPSDRTPGKLSGDVRTRWAWTEPSVWTKPMLATLEEQRVRGGKWHSLMDKDHHRYPNAYFAEQGLFSLKHAHARESQPCYK